MCWCCELCWKAVAQSVRVALTTPMAPDSPHCTWCVCWKALWNAASHNLCWKVVVGALHSVCWNVVNAASHQSHRLSALLIGLVSLAVCAAYHRNAGVLVSVRSATVAP